MSYNIHLDRYDQSEMILNGGKQNGMIYHPAIIQVREFVQSFKAFPPRQASSSPGIDDIIEQIWKTPNDK